MGKSGHLFIKDMEEIDVRVDELSILLDLKVLLKDYYTATFTSDERGLEIKFDNGQKFAISVKEKK